MVGWDVISLWKISGNPSRYCYVFLTFMCLRSLWNVAIFALAHRTSLPASSHRQRQILKRLREIPRLIVLSILLCAFASAWEVMVWLSWVSVERPPCGDCAGGPAAILFLPIATFGCCTVIYAIYCLSLHKIT
jgi:hypothetical protein